MGVGKQNAVRNILNNTNQNTVKDRTKGSSRDQSNQEAIDQLVKKSNKLLISVKTHKFPLDIFPNTLNVEETRITFINRTFFMTSEVRSVDIRDISNIFINFSPVFAQLVIVSKTYSQNNMEVSHLYKKEAIYVRRIVEGLRMFEKKNIDTSGYTTEQLLNELERLSTTNIVQ